MTNDRIRPIREGISSSADKQQFLDVVAGAYDRLAADAGEPVTLVFCFVNLKGDATPAYLTLAPVDDRNVLYLSRGVMAIVSDYNEWDPNTDDTSNC